MTLTTTIPTVKEINFAQQIVEAFRSKSFYNYRKLATTKKDFEEIILDVQHHDRSGKKEEWQKALVMFEEQADSAYRAEFNRIIEEGEIIGVDWNQINLLKFVYQADKPVNSSKTSLHGHINFTFKGKNYVLFGVEAIELSSGYKINMIKTVQEGMIRKYVAPDFMDHI
jgi:hypothetical protein